MDKGVGCLLDAGLWDEGKEGVHETRAVGLEGEGEGKGEGEGEGEGWCEEKEDEDVEGKAVKGLLGEPRSHQLSPCPLWCCMGAWLIVWWGAVMKLVVWG